MDDFNGKISQQKAFTLVEILIVVIFFGILATIIIPPATVSRNDAKLNALKTDLSNMRSAIELYYYQHGNRYPGPYDDEDGMTVLVDADEAVNAFIAQ